MSNFDYKMAVKVLKKAKKLLPLEQYVCIALSTCAGASTNHKFETTAYQLKGIIQERLSGSRVVEGWLRDNHWEFYLEKFHYSDEYGMGLRYRSAWLDNMIAEFEGYAKEQNV